MAKEDLSDLVPGNSTEQDEDFSDPRYFGEDIMVKRSKELDPLHALDTRIQENFSQKDCPLTPNQNPVTPIYTGRKMTIPI